jgi:hypothetical protein
MMRTVLAVAWLCGAVSSAYANNDHVSLAKLRGIVRAGTRIDQRLTAHVDHLRVDVAHAEQLAAASDKALQSLLKTLVSRNLNQAALKQLRSEVTDLITKQLTAHGANPEAAKLVAKRLVGGASPPSSAAPDELDDT